MRHLTALAVLGLLGLVTTLASVSSARAQGCIAPRVMISVDKSSSMLNVSTDGRTHWESAQTALGELAMGFGENIDFALQVFPYPDRCEPGAVTLPFGSHTATQMLEALGEPPPGAGNWTPMAETIDAAAAYGPLIEAGSARHFILITDGWQYCVPHDVSTRFTPVEAVQRMRALGVTVHIVGFGGSVDASTLNRAAVAAGTALPGCNAMATDPADPNHCYHQVGDLTGLRVALDAIARDVTEEVCDGYDNDCDGLIDEGFDVDGDGYTTCGSDPTMPGVPLDPALADCDDTDPAVHPGAEEICDGIDNNCDGVIDPGCDCMDGESRSCGTDVGVCESGTNTCVDGTWSAACEGAVGPGVEMCNGLDDDCDGTIDEDADASCEEGHACTADGCLDLTPPPPEDERPEPEDEEDFGPAPPMEGGCACRAPATQPTGGAPLFGLIGLGLAYFVRRRRPSRRAARG